MPTSLIYNWYSEIKKFAPRLKVAKYHGSKRGSLNSLYKKVDIILTSYGILRNDLLKISDLEFHYVILDESQIIKNPESKTYKAVLEINSQHRLVLTGTPIENSLIDLWAQINFLNEGLLGNFSYFRNEYVLPIELKRDEEKKEKLKQLIRPFILRRTKQQVAKDLPEITEQFIYCDMSEQQMKYYDEEKSKARNYIFENIDQVGIEKSSFMILQALTKLRQIANHPKLVDEDYKHDSGKVKEVVRNMIQVADEGHKVLVFSSFVKNLELYREVLEKKGFEYCILTGETQDRQKIVEIFQNKDSVRFFLISLKAGGVGLNLTAADYVFMLDPWWNPAVEAQAINRAHRIGQQNKVFVYRYISTHTIEEKIQRLQAKKSKLAEELINDNNPFKSFTPEKLKELFE
jgi:SNF2 family DNA or RNA helicase